MRLSNFLCLGLALGLSWHVSGQEHTYTEKLDSLMQALDKNNQWMGAVAISQAGELKYQHQQGWARHDQNSQQKAHEGSLYRIGSISKTFTAVLLLLAEEEGKLSLHDGLDAYYPELHYAKKIKLEQLLQHRSGIHNFTDDAMYAEIMTKKHSQEELLSIFNDLDLDFEPGSQMSYSNTGYVLLGFILEQVYGKTYDALIQEKIVEPLGLNTVRVSSEHSALDFTETGSFLWDGTDWKPMPITHPSVPMAAGALVSRPETLCDFAHQLFSGALVADSSLAKMTQMVDGYGYALFPFPFHENKFLGHTGGVDGFGSLLGYNTEDEVCLAYTGNGSNTNTNDMAIGLLSIFYGLEYQIPDFSGNKISEEEVQAYLGNYQSENFPLALRLFFEKGQLMCQATGQSAFPLTQEKKGVFVFKGAGIRLVFEGTDAFQFSQGGMEFKFEKTP